MASDNPIEMNMPEIAGYMIDECPPSYCVMRACESARPATVGGSPSGDERVR